jgi:hypothetical protein
MGVQTIRNVIIGVSIIAAAAAALTGQLMAIVTDSSKLAQVRLCEW